MSDQKRPLVWLDLEMTGLNPAQHRIIEIATLVTDHQLNVLAEGPLMAIYQTPEHLALMDAWNAKHHGQSGLIEKVKNSSINEVIAQQNTLDFLYHYARPGEAFLCGNSIYQDRRFLYRYMPTLEQFFYYRMLDVSTLKILAQLWAPKIAKGFHKNSAHQAMKDIYDSIEELRYYREHWIQRADTN